MKAAWLSAFVAFEPIRQRASEEGTDHLLNSTFPANAANRMWTQHARFHVVCQVLSYSGLGLNALGPVWIPGPYAYDASG